MQLLKKLFKFYVESNIHVGIAGVSFMIISLYGFSIDEIVNNSLFIFFSVLLSYQFIRVFENCTCTFHSILFFLSKQPIEILIIILISGLGIVYSSSLFKPSQLLILIPAFLLTF